MTPTLWGGIIVVVCMLECVRIGITTYVLVHLLESPALRRPGERSGQATLSLRTASARARREALLDPTLDALRGALDDTARGQSGSAVDAAVIALDRYALALVEEHGRE